MLYIYFGCFLYVSRRWDLKLCMMYYSPLLHRHMYFYVSSLRRSLDSRNIRYLYLQNPLSLSLNIFTSYKTPVCITTWVQGPQVLVLVRFGRGGCWRRVCHCSRLWDSVHIINRVCLLDVKVENLPQLGNLCMVPRGGHHVSPSTLIPRSK